MASDQIQPNWIKGFLTLKQLKNGIVEFLEDHIKKVQENIHYKVLQQLPPGETVVPACTFCTSTLLHKKGHDCPSRVCRFILNELSNMHALKRANLDNTHVQQWTKLDRSWEIAKCFLGGGYENAMHAEDIDCTGLLTILINCTFLHRYLEEDTISACSQVKKIRNNIMHSSELTLDDEQLQDLVKCSTNLLSDRKSLSRYSEAKEALQNIRELFAAPLSKTDMDCKDWMEQRRLAKEKRVREEVELTDRLIQRYQERLSTLNFSKWCRSVKVLEIFAPLVIREDLERRLTNDPYTRKSILYEECRKGLALSSYYDIFHRNEELQREIYMLGKAGIGKTTFCMQLVNIWCKLNTSDAQTKYEAFLKNIKYVFHVCCRDAAENESLLDMILKQVCPVKHEDLVRHLFTYCPEKCLVLVDGLDEWATYRGGSFDLPDSKDVHGCITLTTSRPWRIEALERSLTNTCRILEIHGLDEHGVDALSLNILRELGEKNNKCALDNFKIQIKKRNMTELIKLPLMLTMILITWYKGKQSLEKSLCMNYAGLIEHAIEHSEKKIVQMHTRGDTTSLQSLPPCFDGKKLCVKYALLIGKLARLAFRTLVCSNKAASLVFDKETLTKEFGEEDLKRCLELGLLSESEAPSESCISKISISFMHKSLQEFLAAVYFTGNDFSNCFTQFCGNISSMIDILDYKSVVVFLCGLAPEKGHKVCRYITDKANESQMLQGYRSCSHESLFQCSNGNVTSYHDCLRNIKSMQELMLQCNTEAACQQETESASVSVNLKYSIHDVVIDEETDSGVMQQMNMQEESMKSLRFYDRQLFTDRTELPLFDVLSLTEMRNIEKLCLYVPSERAEGYINVIHESVNSFKHLKTFSFAVSGCKLQRSQCALLFETLDKLPALLCAHFQGRGMSSIDRMAFPSRLQSLSLQGIPTEGPLGSLPEQLSTLSVGGMPISDQVDALPRSLTSVLFKWMSVTEQAVSVFPVCLTSLIMTDVTLSPPACQQLCQYLKGSSSLQILTLRVKDRCRLSVGYKIDLSAHGDLSKLELSNLDLKSGIELPSAPKLCEIYMEDVNMSAKEWETMVYRLPDSSSSKLTVILFKVLQLDCKTHDYIRSNFNLTRNDGYGTVFHKTA